MVKQFSYKNTCFTACYSPANNAYIFTRVDSGYSTEHRIIQSKKEVNQYFRDRVDFFKKIVGLN